MSGSINLLGGLLLWILFGHCKSNRSFSQWPFTPSCRVKTGAHSTFECFYILLESHDSSLIYLCKKDINLIFKTEITPLCYNREQCPHEHIMLKTCVLSAGWCLSGMLWACGTRPSHSSVKVWPPTACWQSWTCATIRSTTTARRSSLWHLNATPLCKC